MKHYALSLIIFNLIFIGCVNNITTPIINDSNKEYHYVNTALNYSIDVPIETIRKAPSPDSLVVGFINYDYTTAHIPSSGYYLSIESTNPETSPCSPTTLGVSAPTDLSEGTVKTLKGRVDYFDGGKDMYSTEPRPLCIPPSLNGLSDEEIGKFAKTRAAYAFCSEKDGKTVLICISQMTKNEEVATKIFDSFKWTK